MTDPAEDAAFRLWRADPTKSRHAEDWEFEYSDSEQWVEGAREALAPLRAKHQRVQRPDGSYRCTNCRDGYGGHADWPTGTDRLLYSDAELNPEGTTP
jgi:hypothetical protein